MLGFIDRLVKLNIQKVVIFFVVNPVKQNGKIRFVSETVIPIGKMASIHIEKD